MLQLIEISNMTVHVPTLLRQLGNEKIILDKLPPIVKHTKVISVEDKRNSVNESESDIDVENEGESGFEAKKNDTEVNFESNFEDESDFVVHAEEEKKNDDVEVRTEEEKKKNDNEVNLELNFEDQNDVEERAEEKKEKNEVEGRAEKKKKKNYTEVNSDSDIESDSDSDIEIHTENKNYIEVRRKKKNDRIKLIWKNKRGTKIHSKNKNIVNLKNKNDGNIKVFLKDKSDSSADASLEKKNNEKINLENDNEKKDNNKKDESKQPEKKEPLKINKAYCSRCNVTVDEKKFTGKSCPTCRTMLSYKCPNCNLLFSVYDSLIYHLENSCQPLSSADGSSNSYKITTKSTNKVQVKPTSSDVTIENKIKDQNPITVNKINKVEAPAEVKVDKAASEFKSSPKPDLEKIKEDIAEESIDSDSQIHLSINSSSSSEFDSSRDLDDSLEVEYMKGKYKVVNIQPQSKAVRKLCIPCQSKIHNNDVKKCTACHQLLTSQCIKCERLFSEFKLALTHIEVCNPVSKLTCTNCEFTTTEKQYMREHIKGRCKFLIVNTASGPISYQVCEGCKETFTNVHTFTRHQRYCALYKCEYCSYKTKYKNSYTSHLKTHAKRKKYDETAGFRAPDKYKLKKKMKCEHCDFVTKHLDKMKQHHEEKHPSLPLNSKFL